MSISVTPPRSPTVVINETPPHADGDEEAFKYAPLQDMGDSLMSKPEIIQMILRLLHIRPVKHQFQNAVYVGISINIDIVFHNILYASLLDSYF